MNEEVEEEIMADTDLFQQRPLKKRPP